MRILLYRKDLTDFEKQVNKSADEWLEKTGRESLTETLQGFDFVEDTYRELETCYQERFNIMEYFIILQQVIAEKF